MHTTSASDCSNHSSKPFVTEERKPFTLMETTRRILHHLDTDPLVSCENLTSIVNLEHLMTTPVSFHPQAFIELALSRGVLKFGEFTLKSGRVSPYF